MKLCIDFNSDEAFYIQLINQIILGIAMEQFQEGDSLPSVRQMADLVGINMHTVNKAYNILRQEGFIKLDRRRGAVISIDMDKLRVLEDMKRELSVCLARGICNGLYDAFSKCEAEE
nr:GntR family transcriptional regulator [uncultured Stomatobaculum sp.]